MTPENPIQIRHIEISRSLLDYLKTTPDGSYTRCEAFLDLLLRAVNSPGQVSRFGKTFDLVPGEFVVTLTELAKQWHWSRVTVRLFLHELCDLKQLVITSHVKCSQIDIVSLRFKWGPGQHIFDTLNEFSREDGLVTLTPNPQKPVLVDLDGCPLSDSVSTSPLTDENGQQLYSIEQRRHVAWLTDDILLSTYRRLMCRLYSPKVEKSMLDTYYRTCAGDAARFEELVKALVADPGRDINVMYTRMLADLVDTAESILSAVSRELGSMPPLLPSKTPSADVSSSSEANRLPGL